MPISNKTLLATGPKDAKSQLILAHGAGAPMTSPFMEKIAALLADRGLQVFRFEFAYMAARRDGSKRRPPPKAELLMGEYRDAVATVRRGLKKSQRLLIGGKSMGGRVASLVADDLFAEGAISGLVCLGYPFHPPGKPEKLRTAHLLDMHCPTLIVQGERDPFGHRDEVEAMQLSSKITLQWADDGDHDLGPRGNSGFTRAGNLTIAADAIAVFASSLSSPK